MKICIKCGVEKPHTEYAEAPRMKDGHRNDCKECRRAYHRINSKKHYKRTRVEKLAKVKAYNEINRDTKIAYLKEYRKRDYAIVAARLHDKAYRADPRFRKIRSAATMRYYSRKYNAVGYASREQIDARWEYYGHRCWICNNLAAETDHVIPLSKGGTNWPANLRPICKSCNVRKSNQWPYVLQLTSN